MIWIILAIVSVLVGYEAWKINKLKMENRKLKNPELTEQKKKEYERTKTAFNNLMGYGYEDALKKKE